MRRQTVRGVDTTRFFVVGTERQLTVQINRLRRFLACPLQVLK